MNQPFFFVHAPLCIILDFFPSLIFLPDSYRSSRKKAWCKKKSPTKILAEDFIVRVFFVEAVDMDFVVLHDQFTVFYHLIHHVSRDKKKKQTESP